MLPQQFHPFLQGMVSLPGKLDKPGDFLDGHAGVLQAADQSQPLQVLIRILAETSLGPFDPGDQSLFFIIPQRMRRQACLFAYVLN